jgi:hypothetical protein
MKSLVFMLVLGLAGSAQAAPKKKPKRAPAKKAKAEKTKFNNLHEKFLSLDVNADGFIDDGELFAYGKKLAATKRADGSKLDAAAADAARRKLEARFKRETSVDDKLSRAEYDAAESTAPEHAFRNETDADVRLAVDYVSCDTDSWQVKAGQAVSWRTGFCCVRAVRVQEKGKPALETSLLDTRADRLCDASKWSVRTSSGAAVLQAD